MYITYIQARRCSLCARWQAPRRHVCLEPGLAGCDKPRSPTKQRMKKHISIYSIITRYERAKANPAHVQRPGTVLDPPQSFDSLRGSQCFVYTQICSSLGACLSVCQFIYGASGGCRPAAMVGFSVVLFSITRLIHREREREREKREHPSALSKHTQTPQPFSCLCLEARSIPRKEKVAVWCGVVQCCVVLCCIVLCCAVRPP